MYYIMVNIQIFITILFILIIILFIKTTKKPVKYVISDVDSHKYLVRDLKDSQRASNMLAKLKQNMMTLTNHLIANKKNFPGYEKYIDQLNEKIKDVDISESDEDSEYTSYSVNKGEQIVFCIRSKKNVNKIHDINLVMYVALHEMAHVACPSYGHTEEFKKIFAFFVEQSMKLGIYNHIPFDKQPEEYCGLTISETIV